MKREIKKGITILHTEGAGGATLNKHGYKGIYTSGNKYCVAMTFGHRVNVKKYLIGTFDTIEEAAMARRIAELKRKQGCFEQWFASRPSGHCKAHKEFWKHEFERMNEYENCRRNY